MFKKEEEKQIVEEVFHCDGVKTVKRYIKGRLLGKGGFAKCFEFLSEQTGKKYAAKVIEKESLIKAKTKCKLQSEIKIHKALRHGHIVRFEHFFEDHEYVYILLEICPNQTLNELLKRRKRLTETEVKYYVYQIISAIRYLHSQRVIHRDLKLGNLFLSEGLEIKLGDFGLAATLLHEGQKRKTVCGTPNYIAPEILEGKGGHSYEVDIWSLGVITYTLLFGKPPFETNDVKSTYARIKSCSFAFPDYLNVSATAKKFVSRMLQLEPHRRSTLNQLMADDFLLLAEIPKSLPRSTLACPPNQNFFDQLKKQSIAESQKQPAAECCLANHCELLQNGMNSSRASGKSKAILMSTQRLEVSKMSRKASMKMTSCISTANLKKHSSVHEVQSSADQYCWVTHFEDHSSYGLCYLLSTSATGMRFNDTTCMVSNPKFTKFKYVTVQGNLREQSVEKFESSNYPASLAKKIKIISHFNRQLRARRDSTPNPAKPRLPNPQSQELSDGTAVYVNRYLNSIEAHIFWFSNKTMQVIFRDSAQMMITKIKTTFVDSTGLAVCFLSSRAETQSEEIKVRLKHISDVLKKLKAVKKELPCKNKENIMPRSSSQSKIAKETQQQHRLNGKNYASTNKLALHG